MFGGVPRQYITVSRLFVYHYNRPFEYQCFVFPLVCFLNSLIGEMEGKEREREEN